MNSFFKDVVSHLLKNAFEGHTKFSVADNTAVGDNPIRAISLDAVPANEDTLISLSWDGGDKLFEKTLSEQEASHQFDLISTDLAEVAALTKQGEYDAAKDLMKKLGQKYAENTGDIVDTNLPKLHNTQAAVKPYPPCPCGHAEPSHKWVPTGNYGESFQCGECNTGEACELPEEFQPKHASQDDKLWRKAKITMQNLWFSTTDELLDYQQKQKGAAKPGADQDHIPLWDKNKKAPAAKDQLAPASLSYEDVENQKEREHEDMQKHIDEKIKTELESALQEKAASVFGPDQVELVQVLKKNGRNWDEIKKILIKDFNFDKDSVNIFVDEQRQGSDPTGIEVKPEEEKPEDKKPLTPPEELVSPETHEKLLKDHEDKKKDESPVKEPGFSPKEVMDIPEDDEITDHSSLDNEIARADNDDIHKVAAEPQILRRVRDQMISDRFHIVDNKTGVGVGIPSGSGEQTAASLMAAGWVPVNENDYKLWRKASLKSAAPNDLNPLQEPIQEKPTSSVPQQDKVPMGRDPLDHDAPQKGDRVFVSSDLTDEKAGFEATYISDYKSEGVDFSIVETDAGDLLDIESHRVVKTSEGDSAGSTGAQDTEPVMEPEIATTKEEDIPVTPKMDDLHSLSSQDPFFSIKKEAEDLLKDVDNIGKTAFCFPKDGLKKSAAQNDSAFEGNGWVRVWVDQDDVELDKGYAEAMKIPDEMARIQALKEIARTIAFNNLSEAQDNASMYASFYFDSLVPSDHDRIDWGALANPVNEEEEDRKFEEEMARKYGPDAAIPPQAKSSLEPKVEKKAEKCAMCPNESDGGGFCAACRDAAQKQLDKLNSTEKKADSVMDTKCEDCGKPLGPEAFLSKWPVCGDCTRKKHKKVTQGSDFEKGISQNKTSDETLPAKPRTKVPSLKDKDIDPYKFHSNLEWEPGDPCKLCKSPVDENCVCTNPECEFCKDRIGQAYAATKPEGSEPDQVDLIMAYEDGSLDEAGILKLFSQLIKSGDAWSLQGSYGRTAKALIDAGYINQNGTIIKDVVDTEIAPEQKMLESSYSFKMQRTAADPPIDPKTRFKELKITPKYVEKDKAVPATPEMSEVFSKIESLEHNLSALETARKQIQAKMKEQLALIDSQGERVQMEEELQASIEKAGILVGAVDSQVIAWKDKLYTMQKEEISYVPNLTPKEMLAKVYAKFEGAEKYVQDVLNGMLSQSKNIIEKTLIRWPNKKSSLSKESSILDDLNSYNEELLAALKLLSQPL